jgi:hypothetical protein
VHILYINPNFIDSKAKFQMTTGPDINRFSQRIDELKASLDACDPFWLASNTGTIYEPVGERRGIFRLNLWENELSLSFPEFTAQIAQSTKEISSMNLAMLLYYYHTADGAPLTGQWISFADLPSGRFYNQAFQGYTGMELARAFCDDQLCFEQAARSLGGKQEHLGNASYSFRALPRIPLLVIYWQGDEDVHSSFQVLFDASAFHFLPTDAYAILGSTLTRNLINRRKAYASRDHS